VFRIAQEALANATRHGRPPIRVRYEAASSRASLVIDDAGPGVTGGRVGEAERGLGLVGMRERAESIGAVLEIGSAAGRSRVSLLWTAGAS
jgi:signal transduction histidine kinase